MPHVICYACRVRCNLATQSRSEVRPLLSARPQAAGVRLDVRNLQGTVPVADAFSSQMLCVEEARFVRSSTGARHLSDIARRQVAFPKKKHVGKLVVIAGRAEATSWPHGVTSISLGAGSPPLRKSSDLKLPHR
jgi:hypothetical protein